MRFRRMVNGLAAAALLLAGCGGEAAPAASTEGCRVLRVVVTTSVLGDIVQNAVGEAVNVEVLMPVGADPHSFSPSASQAGALREADLVVANGLGLEEGLQGVVAQAAAAGVTVVEATSFVDPLPFAQVSAHEEEGEAAQEEEGEEAHEHDTLDPHIWTDPARMAEVATGLGEALAAADPSCGADHREAAAAYRQRLEALDAEIEGILAAVPPEDRKLVTSHHAFGYFADRYGFEMIGAIIPGGSTLAEPSPADLAALVEILRREGVRAVFAETTQPADLAEALAAELSGEVAVVSLYTGSLGEAGSGADTYIGMQRVNAQRIAGALGEA
ncbi:MAG: zinc ABC transporter substrate-binding protein [Acidimicrobiia bacterium]|nr:zinc ABC transporter substrate-binding protein [Acidimicrobiia bacterium]